MLMKGEHFKKLFYKLGKKLAWLATFFVKPITVFRWTGFFPFRVISFQEFGPVLFQDQALLNVPKPRCIRGEELWTPLKVSGQPRSLLCCAGLP